MISRHSTRQILEPNNFRNDQAYLFSLGDSAAGNDNDLAVLVKWHHLGHAVRHTRVVDVSGQSACHCSVNNHMVIYPEHVHTTVLQQNTSVDIFYFCIGFNIPINTYKLISACFLRGYENHFIMLSHR